VTLRRCRRSGGHGGRQRRGWKKWKKQEEEGQTPKIEQSVENRPRCLEKGQLHTKIRLCWCKEYKRHYKIYIGTLI
jgi:hypothetical protein